MRSLTLLGIVMIGFSSVWAQGTLRTINVYFHNEKRNPNMQDCTKVFPTPRQIPATKAVAKAALLELFKGTTAEERAKEFWSIEPENTAGILKKVNIKGNAAYVNFDRSVYEKLGVTTTSCGSGFYSSIEKTLTQFSNIKKVYYAIDGNTDDFYEWVQVGECPHGKKYCSAVNFK